MVPNTLLVFVGAGIGGLLRYGVTIAAARASPTFPWATFTVNIAGSLLMGLLAGILIRRDGHEAWRLFLGTGVLGGFTTFSAFSLDLATLIDRGALTTAFTYALASVIVSLAALYVGLWLARLG